MDIQVLGAHDCESQNSKLVCLLVDDVLALDAGALTSTLSFSAQQKLKAILVTHRHYDHTRDIPAIAFNLFLRGGTINVYSISDVCDAIMAHLLNGKLYAKFWEKPQGNPAVKFNIIEPGNPEQIQGYNVLAVPVNHSTPTVGYQITSPDGKVVFYAGDTGPGLIDCWRYVSPQLLIIEVTCSNRYKKFVRDVKHLTPDLLKQELVVFREIKGYLPPVVLVHMNPEIEKEIETEIAVVAESLNSSISLAYEGMQIHL
jgi:ribonuclease BN (tRNA processing enzyme)